MDIKKSSIVVWGGAGAEEEAPLLCSQLSVTSRQQKTRDRKVKERKTVYWISLWKWEGKNGENYSAKEQRVPE